MKRPGRLTLFFLACGSLATVAVGFFLNSEAGLRWVLRGALASMPAELSVASVEGRLLGPVSLRDIRLQKNGALVSIAKLNLDWRPGNLLGGKIHISLLEADHIRIEMSAQSTAAQVPEDASFELMDISLPVAVVLERLALRDISVLTSAGDAPFQLTMLTAALAYDRQSFVVQNLDMEGPQLSFSAQGRIEPAGAYPVHLEAGFELHPDAYPVTAGELTISGDLKKRLEIRQILDLPVHTVLTAYMENIFDHPAWNGRVEIGRVKLTDLNPEWENLSLEGYMLSRGTLQSFSIEAHMAGDYQEVEWHANLDGRYEDALLNIGRLALSLPQQNAQMELQGEAVITDARQAVEVEGSWRNLSWPLRGPRLVNSPSGRLRLGGTLDAYRFEINGQLEGPDIPSGRWSLAGSGTPDGVELQRLQGDVLGGRLDSTVTLRWAPELEWRFSARGRGLDPSKLWEGVPEQLDFSLRGDGALRDEHYAANVRLEGLSGMLRGAPLAGWGNIAMDQQRVSISPLVLTAGESHLVLAGELSEQWAMSWRVDAPDLRQFYPPVSGGLESSGSISGPRENPAVGAVLEGQGLAYGEHQVAQASVSLDWDPSDLHASRLHISLVDVEAGGQKIKQLDIQGMGRASQHRVFFWLDSAWGQLTGRVKGAYQEAAWQGEASETRLTLPSLGVWGDIEPARLQVAKDYFNLKPWCLVGQGDARVCMDALWKRGATGEGNLLAENLPLGIVEKWLPADITINGVGDLQVHATQSALGVLEGNAKFSSDEGLLAFEVTREDEVRLTYRDFQVSSSLQQGVVSLSVTADLEEQGSLDGQLQLPVMALDPQSDQVAGAFEASLREFGMLSLLIPDAENIQGELQAKARISGVLGKADIDLDFDFSKGSIAFPSQGIAVNDISLRVQSTEAGENVLNFKGDARSGPGRIQANGLFRPGVSHEWRFDIDVKGQRFEVINTSEFRILVSPDLSMSVDHDAASISGVVRIPEAVLRPKTFSGAVRPSSDAIILGEDENQGGGGFAVTSKVRIQLGDYVRFDGFGLKGRIAGQILVVDTPGQLTSGTGELSIREGTFKAYGQNLIIERGRLVFVGGPIDTPGLDIRAIRKVEEVTVGLNVSGDVVEPRLSIFSDPAMSETEALSYLLLGRPLKRDETGKDSELSGAALALGVGGASLFGKKLGEGLGIDEVGIETESGTGEVQLKMGTYLSPKLYVGYSRSLAEQLNIYMVRYRLSRSLSISGESSSKAVGGDLHFTIEKD